MDGPTSNEYDIFVDAANGAVASHIAVESRELAAAVLEGLIIGFWWRPGDLKPAPIDARVAVRWRRRLVLSVKLQHLTKVHPAQLRRHREASIAAAG